MWKHRKAKDYFGSENIEGQSRDCISKKTVKGFLERLAWAEGWLLKYLLGDNYVVKAAAVNVKVLAKRNNFKSETFVGDLYVVQNIRNKIVSFKLYCPKDNKFVWGVDSEPSLSGYLDLNCNTHVLHLKESIYTIKFPDKKERTLFTDSLNKFLYFEKTKR